MGVKDISLQLRSGFFWPPQWFTLCIVPVAFLWTSLSDVANWRWRQTACKPGSVRTPRFPWTVRDDHSSGTRLAARLARPTRTTERECSCALRRGRPYSVLLPVGFALPPLLPGARCALAAPFRPCPRAALAATCTGGLFSVALSLGSPPPAVSRHRIPVEPGLSSARSPGEPGDKQQPSGRLAINQLRVIAEPVKRRVARSLRAAAPPTAVRACRRLLRP